MDEGTEDLIAWLQEQPLMQRCLICQQPATGIGVVVPLAGVALAYAACRAHRRLDPATWLTLQLTLAAPPEINMADTDVSVH